MFFKNVSATIGNGMDKIASLSFWRMSFKLSSCTSGLVDNWRDHHWILRRKRHGPPYLYISCSLLEKAWVSRSSFKLASLHVWPEVPTKAAVVMIHTGQEDFASKVTTTITHTCGQNQPEFSMKNSPSSVTRINYSSIISWKTEGPLQRQAVWGRHPIHHWTTEGGRHSVYRSDSRHR